MEKPDHQPVLFAEAMQQLAIRPNGIYVDCTFGRGGHSRGILQKLDTDGRLLAFDRDSAAVDSEQAKLLRRDPRFHLHHGCFSELSDVIDDLGYRNKVNGILLDLGVSSPQLDEAARGFSFLKEGALDMRMNADAGLSADQYLMQVEEKELARVLFEYGEERFARRIARAIVERRQQPLRTTRELAELVESAVPFRDRHKHPATRTFQAIRIEINRELEELGQVLKQAVAILAPGGRLVVISFHSLEDRLVKRFIRAESGLKHDPGRLPVPEAKIACGELKKIGKSIRAEPGELAQNPRARSAVMRVAEKV